MKAPTNFVPAKELTAWNEDAGSMRVCCAPLVGPHCPVMEDSWI